MSKGLVREIITQIESYLAGKARGQEIAAWAITALTQHTFSSDEVLVEDALTALAGLHDGDERFDTAREDLVYYKNCLLAKAPYTTSFEVLARKVADEQAAYGVESKDE